MTGPFVASAWQSEMERQYIWFHTGVAFVVAAIGAIAGTAVLFLFLGHLRGNIASQFAVTFAVYAIAVLPAFAVERSVLGRGRRNRPDAKLANRREA